MKTYGPGIPKGHSVYMGVDQSYGGFSITYISKEDPTKYKTVVKKFEGGGITRLVAIAEFIVASLNDVATDKNKVIDAAIEGYAYGSQMSHMLGELGAIVKLVLFDNGMTPLIIPPTTLKKYVAGKGKDVKKSQMLLAVFKKWGVELTDDNAADSYSLARIASGYATVDYEKAIQGNLKDPKYREKQNG
jgi:Holliday junction resolvasome RuvABC endonuclease subunit